jgi:beta-lactamase regulating signal transducer with metallopeptidase domain
MTTWLDFGASNALAGTVLAVFAWVVSRACGRPQVVFAVWVLVLAKLVAPPLVALPVESLRGYLAWTPAIVPRETTDLPVIALLESDELPSHLRLPSDSLVATAPPDLMESQDGALELDEIDQLGPGVAALESDEIPFRFADEVQNSDVAPVAVEPFAVTHLLLSAWLIGSSLWFALAAARIMRFRRLLKLARPAAPALEAEVRALACRMQLSQVPEVRVVRRRVSPLVWALGGRATLLLPSDLLRRLTLEERNTLLAHELAHLKRRDHLVRLLELAALGLFWWHPVAWWARRNAERAAEHCCDAQVIELFPAQARAYALALWATVDFLSDAPEALPLGASGFSQAGHVKRRMEMILANTHPRRACRSLRFFLLAIGLAVLPLSLRSLWAEPPAPATAETQHEEVEITVVGDDVELEAGATDTVDVEEFVEKPDSQEVALVVGFQEIEEDGGKPAPKTSSIEERLDRLEKMIQKLAEGQASGAAPAAKPQISVSTRQRAKEEKRRYDKAATEKANSPETEPLSEPTKEDTSDSALDTNHRLADIVRLATMHLELSKTNLARFEAAKRQAEAVNKAFEADTVSLDQVLEAQRRVVEAYLSYVRETAALEPKALERNLVVAKAGLEATNRALKDAHETWRKVHEGATPGSAEEKSEAQAREQYFQLKQQAQTLLKEYKQAESAFRHRSKAYPQKDEANNDSSDIKARHKLAAEKIDKLAQAKLEAVADDMKRRMADAEKVQVRAKLEIEKARHEADEARWKLEGLEKHARLREQEAEAAAKVGEAAAKNLEALKAAEDSAKESTKSEAPK